jgi:hypothetical protein
VNRRMLTKGTLRVCAIYGAAFMDARKALIHH